MTAAMERGVPQADGSVAAEPTMDVAHVADAVRLHGRPAARRQRPLHDRDGDEDAVRGPGMMGAPPRLRSGPCAAMGAWYAPRRPPAALAALTWAAAPASARSLQVGVDDDGVLLGGGDAATDAVSEWQKLGVDTVRLQVSWSRVAPDPGSDTPPPGFVPGTRQRAATTGASSTPRSPAGTASAVGRLRQTTRAMDIRGRPEASAVAVSPMQQWTTMTQQS